MLVECVALQYYCAYISAFTLYKKSTTNTKFSNIQLCIYIFIRKTKIIHALCICNDAIQA